MLITLKCSKCKTDLLECESKTLEVGCEGVVLIYSEELNKGESDIVCTSQHNPDEYSIVCPKCGYVEPITGINYIE